MKLLARTAPAILPDSDGSTPMEAHFGVGEFNFHFRTYFSGWIGMFTAGTIWILTHGQTRKV